MCVIINLIYNLHAYPSAFYISVTFDTYHISLYTKNNKHQSISLFFRAEVVLFVYCNFMHHYETETTNSFPSTLRVCGVSLGFNRLYAVPD